MSGREIRAGETAAMHRLGRTCQMAALIGLPLSIPLQLLNRINLGQMLALMAASLCLFYIGRLIEGYGTPRGDDSPPSS